jgi:hypothetical protein
VEELGDRVMELIQKIKQKSLSAERGINYNRKGIVMMT